MTRENAVHPWMILAAGLVVAAFLWSGVWFWRQQEQHLRQSVEAGLKWISHSKIAEIAAWRAGHIRNGVILMDDSALRQAVAHWMALRREGDAQQILDQFRTLQKRDQFADVILLDPEGKVGLSLGDISAEVHPQARQTAAAALEQQRPLFTDLHAGPGGRAPHVGVAVPLFSREGDRAAPLGVVLLLVDARQFLYPMIQSWPAPSRSAETLLVRGDAGSVLFLNDVRQRPDSALALRIPLDREDQVEVLAVQGHVGVLQATDYRGEEVLSIVRPVPDTTWTMVNKVDAAEVFSDWRHYSILTLSVIALSLVAAVAAAGAWWQRRQKLDYQALLQTQAALNESHVRFQGLFENAINGVAIHEIVLDEKGAPADYVFLEANQAFETQTGLRVADVLGKRVTEALPGIEKSGLIEVYGNVALNGERIAFEKFSEQLGRHYNISAFPIGLGRFATVFQDITDQRLALAKLQESEARLRAITDSAQDAILMMDPDGRVSYWNPAAERIFGYTGAEAIGGDLHNLIAPQRFHPAHEQAFEVFKRTGQGGAIGRTISLQALHRDGHEISVELSLSAVQGRGGWQAVGILRDATERKLAEEEIRQTNRELERATLHANEMALQAELANAAKSEFLANMSHEIRTPMNGVIGMTGLLLDTGLSPEQRRYAEIVRTSAEALLSLINDILDFSKIESRKLALESLDFDLRLAVEDAFEVLADRAAAKGIELICLTAPEVPCALRGDPGRLRQVILNVAGNAVKFTHAGEVALRVSLRSETAERAELLFEVSDTGIGIPEIMIPLLFSPFTQVDGSTTRKYGGTGLGLAISKQLVELMGGQVGVNSQEGQGSKFWFTASFEKASAGGSVPANLGDLRGVRVLITDDNHTNRLLLATLLKSWGCLFAEAADADQAIEALSRAAAAGQPFDIAILDMHMPGMDGETLGGIIRSSPAIRDTRLVMMSSLGERGQIGHLKEMGFSGYLTKPIRQSQIRECLSLVMGRETRSDANPMDDIITCHTITESYKRRMRILVAEDNTTNQILALEILKKLGYRADAVANGQEALSAVQSIPYDLVLMDCQMPVMDGFEATRRIRSPDTSATKRQIPIIAMTAHALKGDRERCLEAGMSDYLSKPVKPGDLARMLERWLQAAPVIADAPGADTQRSGDVRLPIDLDHGSQTAKSGAVIFDREGFLRRMMGDTEIAETIVETFLCDMPVQIEKLGQAAAEADCRQSEQHAHRIKGAAANLGAAALEMSAAAMEQAGREGEVSKLPDLTTRVNREFEILRAVLEKTGPGSAGHEAS